jgi:hypothetical protein
MMRKEIVAAIQRDTNQVESHLRSYHWPPSRCHYHVVETLVGLGMASVSQLEWRYWINCEPLQTSAFILLVIGKGQLVVDD